MADIESTASYSDSFNDEKENQPAVGNRYSDTFNTVGEESVDATQSQVNPFGDPNVEVDRNFMGDVGTSLVRGGLGIVKLVPQVAKIVGSDILGPVVKGITGTDIVKEATTPFIKDIEALTASPLLKPSKQAGGAPIDLERIISDPGEVIGQITSQITNPRFWASQLPEGAMSMIPAIVGSWAPRAVATAGKLGKALEAAKVAEIAGEVGAAAKVAEISSKIQRLGTIGMYGASMAMEAGQGEEKVREYEEKTGEKISWGSRVTSILGTGIIAGGMEAFSLGRVVPGALLGRKGSSPLAVIENILNGKGGREIVNKVLAGVATEGLTEPAQSIVENAFPRGFFDKNQKLLEGVVESMLIGAALGGLGGGAESISTHREAGAFAREGGEFSQEFQDTVTRIKDLKEKATEEYWAQVKPVLPEKSPEPVLAPGVERPGPQPVAALTPEEQQQAIFGGELGRIIESNPENPVSALKDKFGDYDRAFQFYRLYQQGDASTALQEFPEHSAFATKQQKEVAITPAERAQGLPWQATHPVMGVTGGMAQERAQETSAGVTSAESFDRTGSVQDKSGSDKTPPPVMGVTGGMAQTLATRRGEESGAAIAEEVLAPIRDQAALRDQVLDRTGGIIPQVRLRRMAMQEIEGRLARGEEVEPEVLARFPELAKKYEAALTPEVNDAVVPEVEAAAPVLPQEGLEVEDWAEGAPPLANAPDEGVVASPEASDASVDGVQEEGAPAKEPLSDGAKTAGFTDEAEYRAWLNEPLPEKPEAPPKTLEQIQAEIKADIAFLKKKRAEAMKYAGGKQHLRTGVKAEYDPKIKLAMERLKTAPDIYKAANETPVSKATPSRPSPLTGKKTGPATGAKPVAPRGVGLHPGITGKPAKSTPAPTITPTEIVPQAASQKVAPESQAGRGVGGLSKKEVQERAELSRKIDWMTAEPDSKLGKGQGGFNTDKYTTDQLKAMVETNPNWKALSDPERQRIGKLQLANTPLQDFVASEYGPNPPPGILASITAEHKAAVKFALEEGKIPKGLTDHPDLISTPKTQAKSTPKPLRSPITGKPRAGTVAKAKPVAKHPGLPKGIGKGKAAVKVVKGTYYWKDAESAKQWAEANGWPTDRINEFDKGYAVQSGKSGNYAGPGVVAKEWKGKGEAAKTELSPAILQGMKDWLENKAYIDNAGNYRLSETKKVAPWNKEVKAAFPDGGIHEAAQKQYPEIVKEKEKAKEDRAALLNNKQTVKPKEKTKTIKLDKDIQYTAEEPKEQVPSKEQKEFAINRVVEALKNHPEMPESVFEDRKDWLKQFSDVVPEGIPEFIEFHVPGDGDFKIRNSLKALAYAEVYFKKWPTGKMVKDYLPGSAVFKDAKPLSKEEQQRLIESFEDAKLAAVEAIKAVEIEPMPEAEKEAAIWRGLNEVAGKYNTPASVLHREAYKLLSAEDLSQLRGKAARGMEDIKKAEVEKERITQERRTPPTKMPEVEGPGNVRLTSDEIKESALAYLDMQLAKLSGQKSRYGKTESSKIKKKIAAIKKGGSLSDFPTSEESEIKDIANAVKSYKLIRSSISDVTELESKIILSRNSDRNDFSVWSVENTPNTPMSVGGRWSRMSSGATPGAALVNYARYVQDRSDFQATIANSLPKEVVKMAGYAQQLYDDMVSKSQGGDYWRSVEQALQRGDYKDVVYTAQSFYKQYYPELSIKEPAPAQAKEGAAKKYSLTGTRPAPGEGPTITLQAVQERFGGVKVQELDGGKGFHLTLPNGKLLMILTGQDLTARRDEVLNTYGREMRAGEWVAGEWQPMSAGGVISLAKGSGARTLDHEVFHAACDLVLTKGEWEAVLRKYGDWEAAARAYETWKPAESHKFFQKILNFFRRLAQLIGPTAHGTFAKIKSGEVWTRTAAGPGTGATGAFNALRSAQATLDDYHSTLMAQDPGSKSLWRRFWDKDPALKASWTEFTQKTYDHVVDRFAPGERAQEKLTKAGIALPAGEQFTSTIGFWRGQEGWNHEAVLGSGIYADKVETLGTGESFFTGATPTRVGDSLFKRVDPIRTLAKARSMQNKEVFRDLRLLMVAQRDLELAGETGTRAPGEIKGVRPDESRAALQALETKYGNDFSQLQEVANGIREWADQAILQRLVQGGIITQELYDKIKAKNQAYVPFARLMDELDQHIKSTGGGKVIKEIKGSERAIVDPFQMLIELSAKANYAYAKNRMIRSLYQMGQASPEMGITELKPKIIPSGMVRKDKWEPLGKSGWAMERELPLLKKGYAFSQLPPEPGAIPFYRDGKRSWLKLPPDLYGMTQNLLPEDLGLLMRVLKWPADVLRTGAVTTPEFGLIKNPLRDLVQAWLFNRAGFSPAKWFRDLYLTLSKDPAAMQMRSEMAAGGGFMATLAQSTVDEKITAEDIEGKKKNIAYVAHPVEALRTLSAYLENLTRFSLYKQARENGFSHAEAVHEARRTTLDFRRLGGHPVARYLNMIIPFWNANIQGTDKLITELRGPNKAAVMRRLGALTAASIGLALLFHDDDRLKELEDWEKNYFWHIPLGKTGPIIRLPKPFEAGIMFGSIPERLVEVAMGDNTTGLQAAVKAAVDALTPEIIPAILRPLVELKSNYNFFLGRPIEDAGLQNLPVELRSKPWTTPLAKAISAHGGNLIGLSPVKIEHFVRSFSGGLGANYYFPGADLLLRKAGVLEDLPNPQQDAIERAFGVRALFTKPPVGYRAKSVGDFFENVQGATQADQGWKTLWGTDKIDAFLKDNPEAMFASLARKQMIELGKIKKERNAIHTSKALTSEQKKAKLDALDEKIVTLARAGNALMDPAVAEAVKMPARKGMDFNAYKKMTSEFVGDAYDIIQKNLPKIVHMEEAQRQRYLIKVIRQAREEYKPILSKPKDETKLESPYDKATRAEKTRWQSVMGFRKAKPGEATGYRLKEEGL